MIPLPEDTGKPNGGSKFLSQVNAVPYIDVMLVLLVIFIITAPFLKSAVDVDLPETRALNQKSEPHKPIMITIDAKGRYFLNVGKDPKKATPLSQLVSDLKKVRNTRKEFEVLVQGDRRTSYGVVAELMSELQAADIRKLSLITRPKAK